ncbi:MAG: molybdenum cofactor guanylyltransferase [Terriglobales bacterium]|jgi:molybdopterin-guanine dinucleotide biosynthesis protein A
MNDQPSRAAFLQAGGKSSRMGENKAFINFQGETLLARALATLRAACHEVTIVGDPAIFAPHAPVISDIFPNCGPLAGIHSALAHSPAELNLILAVDMPFVTANLLQFLFDAAASTTAIITVPRTARGLQPLCAVYRPAFAPNADEAIRAGNYKIDAAFAHIPLRILDQPELTAAGFSEDNFFNLNTPADRLAAAAFRWPDHPITR